MQLLPFETNVCILFQLIVQGYIKEKIGITNFLAIFVISRQALAREGDYEMMPVCACVC